MISIGTRTFADGAAKYVSLANAEIVRPLPCGKYWSRVRVGIRYSVNYTLTDNMSPNCYFGLCVGPTGVSNGNVALTYGVTMLASNYGGSLLTYTAASGLPYLSQNAALSYISARAGYTVISTSGIGGGETYFPVHTGATTLRRSCMVVEYFRSSTAVNIYPYAQNMSTSNVDVTAVGFQEAMQLFTINGVAMAVNTSNAVYPVETTYGYADHLSIFWGSEVFPLEVYEIGVYRVG